MAILNIPTDYRIALRTASGAALAAPTDRPHYLSDLSRIASLHGLGLRTTIESSVPLLSAVPTITRFPEVSIPPSAVNLSRLDFLSLSAAQNSILTTGVFSTSVINFTVDPNLVGVNIGELVLGLDTLPAGPIYLDWSALQEAPDESELKYVTPTSTAPTEPCSEWRALAAAILAFIVALVLSTGQLGPPEQPGPEVQATAATAQRLLGEAENDATEAPHAAAARELRDITSFSAADLAAILGVTRESYQRWLGGGSIKPLNESLLYYVRAILRDAVRRIGSRGMNEWLRTPIEVSRSSTSPLDLLRAGRVDEVHALVVELPDAQPIVNGQVVALQRVVDETDDTAPRR